MDTETRKPGKLRRQLVRLGIVCLVIIGIFAVPCVALRAYISLTHPYGWSHCCDKQLSFALYQYAEKHGGYFPAGETTPEASLSLLYREGSANAELLRGKSVPEETVQRILERGELLGPDTCGWHYVEGLNLNDNPRLALFWDKAGLDHNGGRLKGGGHIVWFVHYSSEHIPEAKWDDFLNEQRGLWEQRKSPKNVVAEATAEFDGQRVRVQLHADDDFIEGRIWYYGGPKREYSSQRHLASVDKQLAGSVKLPFIPTHDLAGANTVVENEQRQIRFVMKDREIIFKDGRFNVVQWAKRQ